MAVQPVISEFMADNKSVRADPDGVFSDWVEVFNPNPAPLDLGGYYLTDNATQLTKWQVPAGTTIPANGYLLFWANSTTTPNPLRPTYTNFALSKDGEYLGLVQPDGVTVASAYAPTFPPQQENLSYGLAGTNVTTPTFGKLSAPTPGTANPTSVQVADVQFGTQRGHFTAAFQLTLTTPTAGATIRYTLDGNTPTSSSTQYNGPITINKTTVVRAIAFKTGSTASVVVANTYVFVDDVIRQPKNLRNQFPTTSKLINRNGMTLPQDTEMDPSIVNGNEAALRTGLQSIPTLSLSTDFSKLFGSTGVYDDPGGNRPEQPVSVELIDPAHPDSNSGVYGIVEAQSHDRMKRSLRLSFKADFGGPTKWATDLMKNGPLNGATADTELDNLVLRAGNNRNWARANAPTAYTEDEWYRATQVAISGEGSHGTFVHLYLNGAYWGLYNVAERPDEKRYAEAFSIDDETTFAINHDGDAKGDDTRWNVLMDTVVEKNMSSSANWNELQQYVDMPQFAEHIVAAWYQGTNDWPYNNWWAAGPANGKVRFYAWDGEFSWDKNDIGNNGARIQPLFTDGSDDPIIKVFQAAMGSAEFRTMLMDTAFRLTANGGPLSDAASQARWDTLTNYISTAIYGESARWGDAAERQTNKTYTRANDWLPEVSKIRNMMSGNADQLLDEMRDEGWYPSISAPLFARRGGNVDPGFQVVLSKAAGSASSTRIYYTIDGTDPRAVGGGLSPSAREYTGPVTLTATANVVVRLLSGNPGGSATWSPKDTSTFTIDPYSKLRIVELMYNPAGPAQGTSDAQDMEFVEIQNIGNAAVNLNGVALDGVVATISGNVTLAPGAFAVVAKNAAAYAARYPGAPAPVAIFTSGSLDNGGETIKLLNPSGGVVHQFRYEDGGSAAEVAAGWLPSTDGQGRSMMIVNPAAAVDAWNLGPSWRASDFNGGTPGTHNGAPSNAPPTVDATTTTPTVGLGASAALAATFADDGLPSGSTLTLTWSKLSGPGTVAFPGGANAASTSATFSQAGTYVLRATVSDGNATGHDDVTITVQPANVAPSVDAGANANVTLPTSTYLLNPTVSDDGLPVGSPLAYAWVEVNPSATPASISNPNVKQPTLSFPGGVGTYTFQLTVSDGVLSASDTVTITVLPEPPNQAPTVEAGAAQTISLPGGATLGGGVSDDAKPSGNPLTIAWSLFEGPQGGQAAFADASAAITTATFTLPGTYTLRLSAGDGEYTTSDDVVITVRPPNTAPTVIASVQTTPITLPNSASVSALVSDDGQPNATPSVAWSKFSGPGTVTFTNGNTANATATFSAPGTYVLRATAHDGALSGTGDVTVVVEGVAVTTLNPTADAYWHRETAGTSFGSAGTLNVKGNSGSGNREAMMKFDLASFPSGVGTAKLRLFGRLLDNRSASLVTQVFATSTGWQENTVNYNNRPASTGAALGQVVVNTTAGGWFEVDVTNYARAQKQAGAAAIAFLLRNPASSSPYSLFASRESANRPELVLTPAAPAVNQAPNVSAGPDRTIAITASASLDGTVTDDGLPSSVLTHKWSVAGGPAGSNVTFANDAAIDTTATFSTTGQYTLRLTSKDGAELTDSDDMIVQVNAGPPAANSITSLVLINRATGATLMTLPTSSIPTINLATLSTRDLEIRAMTATSTVRSVRFGYDLNAGTYSANYRTDSTSPFQLFGSSSTTNVRVGTHRLTAQPFTNTNGGGTAGATIEVRFTVIDQPVGT